MMQHPGTQSTDDPDVQAYGIRTLRIFGGIQIGIGILCSILSLVGVVIYGIDMNKHYCSYNSYYDYDYYQHYSNYRNCRQFKGIAGVLFGYNMTRLIFSGWVSLHKIYIIMCFQSGVMYTVTTTYTRHAYARHEYTRHEYTRHEYTRHEHTRHEYTRHEFTSS